MIGPSKDDDAPQGALKRFMTLRVECGAGILHRTLV
jgi:hypothetical protein